MTETLSTLSAALRADIVIDCPAAHVWKCDLEYPKWVPTVKRAELISGEWDKEGGVILITKNDGVGLDPFYSLNLKIRPYKQMVYKIDTKDGDQMHGFLDISFVETNGKTLTTYSNYVIYQLGSALTLEDLQGEKAAENVRDSYLKPFKKYAEKTWG